MLRRIPFNPWAIALLLSLLLGLAAPPAWALGGTLPSLDAPAPAFELPVDPSTYGRDRLSLADFRGKWLVLYFYPKDFTSGCTLEAQRFQRDLPQSVSYTHLRAHET
jgi:peroxiredoxin Q/BCP